MRATDGKGRHTTAWRELLPLPTGGVLLGTPGLRAVGLHDAGDGPDHTFAEIQQLARTCRFAHADPARPGMSQALAALQEESTLRREHGGHDNYAAYVLHRHDPVHTHERNTHHDQLDHPPRDRRRHPRHPRHQPRRLRDPGRGRSRRRAARRLLLDRRPVLRLDR
ncbi:hypothetical protein [Streptomyces sp. NPDC048644]|uniref:hypothetical protein n=1 Tax=Streptomyces sp. NPDC048644 TaxID=3365582 RepID=UPI0037121B41